MNDRERKRFANALRCLSEAASKAAIGLEQRDDQEFLVGFLTLRLSGLILKEIDEVLLASAQKDAPEFPPIIGG
jgi:hypothetical protein